MTHQFVVSVPGRAQPVCIKADSVERDGLSESGFTFRQGGDVVAELPAADLVARSICLPNRLDPSQLWGAEPICLSAFSEPVRELEPLPAMRVGMALTWFGPWLAGVGFGLVVGFGAALSHVGVW